MKMIEYTNYFLLIGTPITFLLEFLGAPVADLPQIATMWLAIYQLIIAVCIAIYRVFSRENFLIWVYWIGVFLFFSVGLTNAAVSFPWYWPTLLAIYFTYVLHIEAQIHYRHENQ